MNGGKVDPKFKYSAVSMVSSFCGYNKWNDVKWITVTGWLKGSLVEAQTKLGSYSHWASKKPSYISKKPDIIITTPAAEAAKKCLDREEGKRYIREKCFKSLLSNWKCRHWTSNATVNFTSNGVMVSMLNKMFLGDTVSTISGMHMIIKQCSLCLSITHPRALTTGTTFLAFLVQEKVTNIDYLTSSPNPIDFISPQSLVAGNVTSQGYFNFTKARTFQVLDTIKGALDVQNRQIQNYAESYDGMRMDKITGVATSTSSMQVYGGNIYLIIFSDSNVSASNCEYTFKADYVCK